MFSFVLSALLLGLTWMGSPDQSQPTVTVAAINYTGFPLEDDAPDPCGGDPACQVEMMVREAAERGAQLVVVSEYAFDGIDPEHDAWVGHRPLPNAPLQYQFGKLAEELGIYLVVPLETYRGEATFMTQVAFDDDGVAVAKHHKMVLYGEEADHLTPGTTIDVFESPFGRVGLLLCSDLYADPEHHERMVREGGARMVALSSVWTAEGALRWQAAFARDWDVTVVAANGAGAEGRGGGIFSHRGKPLGVADTGYDEIVVRDVPIR